MIKVLLIVSCLLLHVVSPAQNKGDTISVYFASGASSLDIQAQQHLDSLAYNNALNPTKQYTVIGYADIIGSEETNTVLSEERAGRVAQYLKTLGIQYIDTVVAKGEISKPDNAEGYPEDRRVDIITGKKPEGLNVNISKLKKNDVFNLNNMYFIGGQAIMKEESYPILETLLSIMNEHPRLKIRIEGHVHCGWSDIYEVRRGTGRVINERAVARNKQHYKELSTARAKVVHDYLLKNSIAPSRIKYAGLSCEGMEQYPDNNRRVAIRVLEK